MTEVQILWGINTGLLLIVGFAIKHWLAKIEVKVEQCISVKLCDDRYSIVKDNCKSFKHHRHASTGEVIAP